MQYVLISDLGIYSRKSSELQLVDVFNQHVCFKYYDTFIAEISRL